MEVLLREDVDNLGNRGQIVRVRAGYGRNFLLPQGLAIEATTGNKRMIDEQRRVLAKHELRERDRAQQQSESLNGIELRFERKVGEHGVLYGSVTTLDIGEALKELGHKVERRRIGLREPIKGLGEYDVPIKLHRDVSPSIKVLVRKEGAVQASAPAAEAPVEAVEASPAESESEPAAEV
ncbi:MAG: 50S ribosomal protein L9 [Blastocatellia bacterium AA13]|nr:MAG: 50S ribosomal protein L9 [Blastocatellia bacterium AA13]